ncbi:MAG: winged helix-turn-helix domain-containing protein [Deltaproteobacteria bacterium]|nr:winged helix-turn-helix domain-containing protein [Deltaproteobacteria bacterium]
MDTDTTSRRGQRQKSPNAPAYSLQECQEDTRKIFRVESQVPTSRESIAEHLGLAAQSGPFNRKLSSLRQYGLLDPMGKDLRVSDLFLRIDHAADESERRRALREALGRPTIFQNLLAHYENTGMPSDINLTNQLVLKYLPPPWQLPSRKADSPNRKIMPILAPKTTIGAKSGTPCAARKFPWA